MIRGQKPSKYIKKEILNVSLLAGAEGIEPSLTVLETAVLPLNYAPMSYFVISVSLTNVSISL